MSSRPSPDDPVKVLLIDDSALIRLGLKAALESRDEIKIIGEAPTATDGIRLAIETRPDVVLLDLRLPDQPGFSACRAITQSAPATRVLILTSSEQECDVQKAVAAGAAGYLLKDNDSETLAAAILQVASGRSVLDPALAARVFRMVHHGGERSPVDRIADLSYQEQRIVALLTAGHTNKEIGDALGLTEKTVKNYLATVFTKLNITRRSQAAALFAEAGRGTSIRPD